MVCGGQDKTIGKRCYRVLGSVSAVNYLEVPKEARTAPLKLAGRYVYIQARVASRAPHAQWKISTEPLWQGDRIKKELRPNVQLTTVVHGWWEYKTR